MALTKNQKMSKKSIKLLGKSKTREKFFVSIKCRSENTLLIVVLQRKSKEHAEEKASGIREHKPMIFEQPELLNINL